MRRAICFILVLAFCLTLSCTAFAAAPSAGEGGAPSQVPDTDNPKTGDNIMYWVMMMVLALFGLVAVNSLYRKVGR